MPTVVISPFRTLKFLEGGGHFWVYMQYVQALRQLGCEVWWIERFRRKDAGTDTSRVDALLRRLERYGLGGKVILCTEAGGEGAPGGGYRLGAR